MPVAGNTAQEIECSTVLLAVDEFFRQLGLNEIRIRSARDDKPLRMVKTLLHELCKKKVPCQCLPITAAWGKAHVCMLRPGPSPLPPSLGDCIDDTHECGVILAVDDCCCRAWRSWMT